MFLESPSNPACRVIDLGPLRRLASGEGVALVVDSTFASPINFRPLEHGADVVIHSATKYLNGHNDVLGGVVLGTAPYVEEVRQKMMVWGQAPDPFACWLLERGLKTLDVRVQRQNANALDRGYLARRASRGEGVHYAGLPGSPDHDIARNQMSGFGGMLAFELAGGGAAAERLLKRLSLIRNAPSLGGVDTIVSEPRYTSHAHMSAEERAAVGVPDGFVRMSVGVEGAADLIADLEGASELRAWGLGHGAWGLDADSGLRRRPIAATILAAARLNTKPRPAATDDSICQRIQGIPADRHGAQRRVVRRGAW